ncbi:hypothetical protein DM01DRAFT_1397373 [Hesseltinella vesiculosa]|uniref:Uncharacterized protein n=1 Tax=Hesseltinella vesiculosa TaxID=101127 RepID=A0A1X2GTC9_9FUNG|nr:hypothetical protein DM01DRAFT_1397373 [Hesseltinella vesiculosa]
MDDLTWDGLAIDDTSFVYHSSRGIYQAHSFDKHQRPLMAPNDNDSVLDSSQQSADDLDTYFSDIEDIDIQLSTPPLPLQPSLQQQGRGSVMRLGRHSYHQDQGDWAVDLGIDNHHPPPLCLKTRPERQQVDLDDPFLQAVASPDKEEGTMSQGLNGSLWSPFTSPVLASAPPSDKPALHKKKSVRFKDLEEDDDESMMLGLDVPDTHVFQKPRSTMPRCSTSSSLLPDRRQMLGSYGLPIQFLTPNEKKELGHLAKYVETEQDMDDLFGLDLSAPSSDTKPAQRITPPLPSSSARLARKPPMPSTSSTLRHLSRPTKIPTMRSAAGPPLPPAFSTPEPTTSSKSKTAASTTPKPTSKKQALLSRLTAPTYASSQKMAPQSRKPSAIGPPVRMVFASTTKKQPTSHCYQQQRLRSQPPSSATYQPHQLRHLSRPKPPMPQPRARGKCYGDGTEIDHLDDLALWSKRPPLPPARPTPNAKHKPWRENMKKALIHPGDQQVNNVINDMTYDEKQQKWIGNDDVLYQFPTRPTGTCKKRPALIKNMTPQRKSLSILCAGDMQFDPTTMAWYKKDQQENEEDHCLAHIEDLAVTTGTLSRPGAALQAQALATARSQKPSAMAALPPASYLCRPWSPLTSESTSLSGPSMLASTSSSSSSQLIPSPAPAASAYFTFSATAQQAMLQHEQDHYALFQHWPIYDDSEPMTTPSGHTGPQHCYVLY